MDAGIKKILVTKERIPAVILPLSYNGVLFTRALHYEGVPVIGIIKSKKLCFYHTNSCRKVVSEDLYGDSTLQVLREIGETAVTSPVLIATSDEGLKFILRNENELRTKFLFNVPESNTAEMLLEKEKLYAWGNEKFLFPTTRIITTQEELKESAGQMNFPVIFKPNYRDDNWPTHFDKAVICDDLQKMQDTYSLFQPYATSFLASEYILGGDENIETCHVYYDQGRMVAAYTDQKIRQSPPLTGTGAYISSCYNPAIKDITQRFFDSLDHYSGIGGIEFKKDDRSGEYKIIEPFVGRPSSHIYTSLGEGFNFPFLVYSHVAGLKIPSYEQSRRVVSQLDEEFELRSMGYYLKTKKMTIWKYIKTIFTTEVFVRYSIKDPLVGFVYTLQLLKRVIKKLIRKKSGE